MKYVRIEGDVAFVELTQGREALIDAADVPIITSETWQAIPNIMGSHYARSSRGGVYMHRMLMGVSDRKTQIDHINHDTLDNRRANLRVLTNAQNNINRKGAYQTSKVGVRGVSVHHTSHNDLYVFRCHIKTCPLAKYFPYTDEGLAAARHLSDSHYAATGFVTHPAPSGPAPVVRHKQQAPNEYRIEGDTAVLALTRGAETRIDLADLALVLEHRWHACKDASGVVWAKSKQGYLHRFLLGTDAKPIGHLNGDHLDNRRANLLPGATGPRKRKDTA
jgi:hypothetical protein